MALSQLAGQPAGSAQLMAGQQSACMAAISNNVMAIIENGVICGVSKSKKSGVIIEIAPAYRK